MMSRNTVSRRDFLHGIFLSDKKGHTSLRPDRSETNSPEPNWLSKLPPEFSGAVLKMEAARLGGDTENMTEQQMAALVVKAMFDTASAVSRLEAGDTAQEEEQLSIE